MALNGGELSPSIDELSSLFSSCRLFLYAVLGAFVLYLVNKLQNRHPLSLFTAINVRMDRTAHPVLVLMDMILSSILGAAVVVPLTSPTTGPQAILVGLGMTGILSVHTQSGDPNQTSQAQAQPVQGQAHGGGSEPGLGGVHG